MWMTPNQYQQIVIKDESYIYTLIYRTWKVPIMQQYSHLKEETDKSVEIPYVSEKNRDSDCYDMRSFFYFDQHEIAHRVIEF